MADFQYVTGKDLRSGFVSVRGAREHNLKNIDLDIPRDALVVFTGVSGSGKSSLAFGTLYAEAQRRYLESVSPYARRLFHQMQVPEVDSIDGLPPAVALQQQRGGGTTRSSVGSVTTLSNLLRMLYSRAGDYPPGLSILYAESFSYNTPQGACPVCHGLGGIHDITESSMVPDPSLTIREKAVAAWPGAWQGQNLRDILTTMGHDIDVPWKTLPKKVRDWILFTDEQPAVPVYPGFDIEEVKDAIRRKEKPAYQGTFIGAKKYVQHTFTHTQSAMMKKRVAQFMTRSECPACHGKRLNKDALRVKFAGLDIGDMSHLPLKKLFSILAPYTSAPVHDKHKPGNEQQIVASRICNDICSRLEILQDLGLGYLSLDRNTPSLSPGELQRLRLATQVYSNLFGVVYVLDEPSSGLHPADTRALLKALDRLKHAGNSLFVVEHEMDVIRVADWIVDVGPDAGEGGGKILYSGPPEGLRKVKESRTAIHLFAKAGKSTREVRTTKEWLELKDVSKNNLHKLSISFPLGVLTAVTGVSGSGKSTLVSQALVELVSDHLGHALPAAEDESVEDVTNQDLSGHIIAGMHRVKRLVTVDQKPIGRTPRSNLATYTGLFDEVRRLFAATPSARKKNFDAGRFSFNVAKGRCPHCEGEGFVMVELLFLPSVYTPCPTCEGTRYNKPTLEILYNGKNIAEVLHLTVNAALDFFKDDKTIHRSLSVVSEVGLGYLRLGQSATELSGGEAQRIKLATELQRGQKGDSLYILDEPTTGLHPSDVDKLIIQLDRLVVAGNTVIVVEHDMKVAASADWVIDMGPGAGEEGGNVVVQGPPEKIVKSKTSRTASFLAEFMGL